MSNVFDENDFKELFNAQKKPQVFAPDENQSEDPDKVQKTYNPKTFTFQTGVKFVALFIVIFIVSYVGINFSSVMDKGRWFYDVSLQNKTYSKAVSTPIPNDFNPAESARLVIPKIGTDAPILWNVDATETNAKLLEGIVHSKDTALPGKMGNIFLTGHSSYYSWVDSNYKDVFALLDKLEENDKVYIKYESKVFTYVVQSKKVVKPTNTEVMDQGSDYELTLMTCVPIGTNINRLVVKAKQINL